MSHLVSYEEAEGPKDKALAALVVVEYKSSKRLAWRWAEQAAEHAIDAGVSDAYDLLGRGRRPKVEPLRKALEAL